MNPLGFFDNVAEKIRKGLSNYYTGKVFSGYGVSTDQSVRIKTAVPLTQIEASQAKTTNLYRLKSDIGHFEIDGHVKDRSGLDMIRLRHILTGTTIKVSKNSMELLFERSDTQQGKV